MPANKRDYGLYNFEAVNNPQIISESPFPCPNCGCDRTFMIAVTVQDKLLKSGKGTGTYIGCAACPWATPMVAVANSPEPHEDKPPTEPTVPLAT